MIASSARPPLKALFLAGAAASAVADALLRSKVAVDVQLLSSAELRRDLLRLKADVLIVDGRLVGALALVRELRGMLATLPILFLSATIGDAANAIASGASDFALRGASTAELILRLQLLSTSVARPLQRVRQVGALRLDRESRTLTNRSRSVSLSPIELKVLEHLLVQPGRPVSRAQLERSIWGQDEVGSHPTNIAVVYVSYLRRKLARLGDACSIATITHVGYALVIREATGRPTRSVKRRNAY